MSSVVAMNLAEFLLEQTRAHRFEVNQIPLNELERWTLDDDLSHDTGRFFSIEGIAIATNFGSTPTWAQPIIMQPEIGILGFLAKRIDNTLHLLAQAKMEPGNKTMVQFAPTVQATPSNYTRVHGGRATPYLDYFLEPPPERVMIDVLQSEQGSRYYRKLNRNIIVELPRDFELPLKKGFVWLNLNQFRELLAAGNSVNMNARTVLSCIPYTSAVDSSQGDTSFFKAVSESQQASADESEMHHIVTWLDAVKTELQLDVRLLHLGELTGWICDGVSIRHESGRFFRALGVSVVAENREIDSWAQPMISPTRNGYVVFLSQRIEGTLQFLVQARAEPGFIDRVELGATLQLSPDNYCRAKDLPPFSDYLACPESWVKHRSIQSEDGGRFYHDEKTYMVIELPIDERVEIPSNYRWMPLSMIKKLIQRGNNVTVEARSLIACLA